MAKITQHQQILACLRNPNNFRMVDGEWGWVPLDLILDIRPRIGQYNARIKELRGKKHNIPPAKIKRVNGYVHSWYKLIEPVALPKESGQMKFEGMGVR